jgi:hypothetical protein
VQDFQCGIEFILSHGVDGPAHEQFQGRAFTLQPDTPDQLFDQSGLLGIIDVLQMDE